MASDPEVPIPSSKITIDVLKDVMAKIRSFTEAQERVHYFWNLDSTIRSAIVRNFEKHNPNFKVTEEFVKLAMADRTRRPNSRLPPGRAGGILCFPTPGNDEYASVTNCVITSLVTKSIVIPKVTTQKRFAELINRYEYGVIKSFGYIYSSSKNLSTLPRSYAWVFGWSPLRRYSGDEILLATTSEAATRFVAALVEKISESCYYNFLKILGDCNANNLPINREDPLTKTFFYPLIRRNAIIPDCGIKGRLIWNVRNIQYLTTDKIILPRYLGPDILSKLNVIIPIPLYHKFHWPAYPLRVRTTLLTLFAMSKFRRAEFPLHKDLVRKVADYVLFNLVREEEDTLPRVSELTNNNLRILYDICDDKPESDLITNDIFEAVCIFAGLMEQPKYTEEEYLNRCRCQTPVLLWKCFRGYENKIKLKVLGAAYEHGILLSVLRDQTVVFDAHGNLQNVENGIRVSRQRTEQCQKVVRDYVFKDQRMSIPRLDKRIKR